MKDSLPRLVPTLRVNLRGILSRLFIAVLLTAGAIPIRAQDPASDDFERASLGGNWTRFGDSNAEIVNGRDLGAPTSTWLFVGWTASAFDANQFSEIIIADGKPSTMLTQVYVRRRASDLARYGFHFNPESDPANPRWEIKYDGVPSAQTRILASVPGTGTAPGDRLRIEVRGSSNVVIKGFHNGVEVISATDAAHQRITNSGPAGMVSRYSLGTTPPPNVPVFASWRGGSLGPKLDIRRNQASATNFTLLIQTAANKTYSVECADALPAASWLSLTTFAGDGSEKSVRLTNASPVRFYRVLSTPQ